MGAAEVGAGVAFAGCVSLGAGTFLLAVGVLERAVAGATLVEGAASFVPAGFVALVVRGVLLPDLSVVRFMRAIVVEMTGRARWRLARIIQQGVNLWSPGKRWALVRAWTQCITIVNKAEP